MPPFRALFVVATSGAIALTVHSLVREPPPLAVSVIALSAYGALVTLGVFVLKMQLYVDAVIGGPKDARGVALTFDDGPDPETTPAVLDALDSVGAKATFFVIAKKAEACPELVKEMLARGHTIGLHSYAHDRLFALRREAFVRSDLQTGIATLEKLTGARPVWFRPPIGHTNPIIARVATELGLVVVGWSVSARDGTARATLDGCLARVRAGLRDGAIVLLHDASERRDFAPLAPKLVPSVLEAIQAENLSVVPLASWVARR